jgi:release factor glutamine methyltransferase
MFAVDLSPAALAVASRNATRLAMPERVWFLKGDLLDILLTPDLAGTFDFVLSNPPYIGRIEMNNVQREVSAFEPRLALGADLERAEEIYERLFPQALQVLKPGGYVVVEIGYNMRETVVGLLGEDWGEIKVVPDLAGIPRVVSARKGRP